MNAFAAVCVLIGAFVAILAGVGLLRFRTPTARFHAAGKASPVAFVVVAVGAATEAGAGAAMALGVAAVAMVLTLPMGVHLLFRAMHRTGPNDHLVVDELAAAEQEADAVRRRRREASTGER